jgi:hypothetical protein
MFPVLAPADIARSGAFAVPRCHEPGTLLAPGSDLRGAPLGKVHVPRRSLEGPDRPDADRIKIVKGWSGRRADPQERRAGEVAWSDRHPPAADGKPPPLGNTVDVANASNPNAIGDPELIAAWKAPDFDAGPRAFHCARATEISTPR